jgi:hypothetical protein
MRFLGLGIEALSGLVALFGFAATANGSVTIDLLWGGTSTSLSSVSESSNLVLSVVLTNNSGQLSAGGAVTVDYSDALGKLSVVGFQHFVTDNTGTLPLDLGPSVDTGSQVRNINAAAFIPLVGSGLPNGATYLMGTVTFHKHAGPAGTFDITSILTGTEEFVLGDFSTSPVVLNGASLSNVPEPGTASLLALGLGALALASRRVDRAPKVGAALATPSNSQRP